MTKSLSEINKLVDKNDQKILRGLGLSPDRDGRIHCPCPIHGGDNPMGFSYDPQRKIWRCWTNKCHECCTINGQQVKVGTGLIGLVRAIRQVSFPEAINIAEQYSKDPNIKAPQIKTYEKKEEKVFPSHLLAGLNHNVKCFKQMGISEETLAEFHAFYCDNPDQILYGRACLPIFNSDDEIVGFAGYRTDVLEEDRPKWWYAGGVQLGNHLYGLNINKDYIEKVSTVILVEGPKDVMRCKEAGIHNVCSPFSCNITNNQRKLLVDLKVKNIILAFDPDPAGQKNAARVKDKLKLFFNVIDISPHLLADPARMSIEDLHKHFSKVHKEKVKTVLA